MPLPDADSVAESPPVLTVAGDLATITLNRPSKRNRLHDEDLRVLLDIFAAVNADTQVRVLVLTARVNTPNPVFCAGYNLDGFEPVAGQAPPIPFESVPDALERLRPVTICSLNGSVYGGATDLALACDFRLGVEDMMLRMPAAALGLHYYPSGLVRYASRLGQAVAKQLFLTAAPMSATRLLEVGYLDQLLPAAELVSATDSLACQVAALAPLVVQGMKQSLNDFARGDFQLDVVRQRETQSHDSRDFTEGRQAFAERRSPKFKGH